MAVQTTSGELAMPEVVEQLKKIERISKYYVCASFWIPMQRRASRHTARFRYLCSYDGKREPVRNEPDKYCSNRKYR